MLPICHYIQSNFPPIMSVPVNFVATLFEPFFFTPKQCQTKLQDIVKNIQKEGVTGIMRKVGNAIKNHPLDIFVLAGVSLSQAEIMQSRVLIVSFATANAARTAQVFTSLAKELKDKTLVGRVLKVALYGSAVYTISSIPLAAALEWNTLSEAKNYYKGGACQEPFATAIQPSSLCLQAGKSFEECRELIPEDYTNDLYVFTRHPSKAVSIIKINKEVCIFTALNKDSGVTKVCFPDINKPDIRTVEQVLTLTLEDSYKDLNEGKSIRHIGLHKGPKSCGTFHEKTAVTTIDQATCIYTSLHPEAEVSKTCFDPKNPTQITLREAKDVHLSFQADGKPVSIVFTNQQVVDSCKCES